MSSEYKLIIGLVILVVGLPMVGMALSEYHQYDCKVQLAKAGRNSEDIKEICK